LVIDGLPVIDPLGPTPVNGEPTDERLRRTKEIVTWLAETMGAFLLGYPNIADGRVFQDVNPVRNTSRPLSSKGGSLALPFHCDSAWNDDRPDYLVLFTLRASPTGPVATAYADGAAALRQLDPATVAELRRPNFRLQVPTIADIDLGDLDLSEPRALVDGPVDAPEIRVHTSRTDCLRPEAARALSALTEALDEVKVEVPMRPGSILILNNRRGVHGRRGFDTGYGPEERWLLRAYLMADPWTHRAALLAGDALIASGKPAFASTPEPTTVGRRP
jgi:L-asparagine oxygenase